MNLVKKKLIIINGPMGVGKSTVSKGLHQSLPQSVWLDGDWCWMMNPWIFTEENKKMVERNIMYLLRSYLGNSTFEYIIFSWVLHQEEITQRLLDGIQDFEYELTRFTLTCTQEALRERMLRDNRTLEQFEISSRRLRLYEEMNTLQIDTSTMSNDEAIKRMKEQL